LPAAVALAHEIAAFPPLCMRSDRESSYEQWSMSLAEALVNERHLGLDVIRSGETQEGAKRFVAGAGRHGSFEQPASEPAAYVPPGTVPPMTAPTTTPLVAPAPTAGAEPDPERSH
ncbi:MAG TPA: hypothetical protein VFA83_03400, partial [Acidimicrobiales bacterium]|nr:hypothetical protein [Acidimicrobiales bacterium]